MMLKTSQVITTAFFLFFGSVANSQVCIDPDLDALPIGITLTLCDGSVAQGRKLLLECSADGQKNCIARNNFMAAASINIEADNIAASHIIGGVVGTRRIRPKDCEANAEIQCVTNDSFKAVEASRITESKIRYGVVLGGIQGKWPSEDYPMDNPTAYVELTSPSTQLVGSNDGFVFWDSAGQSYTFSADSDMLAANFSTATTLENFGISGTLPANLSPHPDTVRYGVTVGSQTGTLKTNCRNGFNRFLYNSNTGASNSGSVTPGAYNWWDTIDSYGNGLGFPEGPSAGDDWGDEHWCDGTQLVDASSDLGFTTVPAANHLGSIDWDKIYFDPWQGLWFTNRLADVNWATAIQICDGLNNGSEAGGTVGTDWRLPTEKELFKLLIHGITRYTDELGLPLSDDFWSATSQANSTTNAYRVGLVRPFSGNQGKSSPQHVLCVHSDAD